MAKTKTSETDWQDRRLYSRAHVVWDGRLLAGRAEQDCVILDLSASGAMIRLTEPEASRAHVTVSADHFGAFRGRVVWQQDHVIGLIFKDRPQHIARAIEQYTPGVHLTQ